MSLFQAYNYGTGLFGFLSKTSNINMISEQEDNPKTTKKAVQKNTAARSIGEAKCLAKGPRYSWEDNQCVLINNNVTNTPAPLSTLDNSTKFCKGEDINPSLAKSKYGVGTQLPSSNNRCAKCLSSGLWQYSNGSCSNAYNASLPHCVIYSNDAGEFSTAKLNTKTDKFTKEIRYSFGDQVKIKDVFYAGDVRSSKTRNLLCTNNKGINPGPNNKTSQTNDNSVSWKEIK